MGSKRSISVRKLLVLVGVLAVVLALVRTPYLFVRAQLAYGHRVNEGSSLILSYRAVCPPGFTPSQWENAVTVVQIAWCNVAFSPSHLDQEPLDGLVIELHRLSLGATPRTAEGDLYTILDLLAHAKSRAGIPYLSHRHGDLKRSLQGEGKPSPSLINRALGLIGSTADRPVPALAGARNSGDLQVRALACRALAQIGLRNDDQSSAAISALIGSLPNQDPLVRQITIEGLREIGPRAAGALPALIEILERDAQSGMRWLAAASLPAIDPAGSVAVPALVAALRDPDEYVRLGAIESLGGMGPKAKEAIPPLIASIERGAGFGLAEEPAYDRLSDAEIAALGRIGLASTEVMAVLFHHFKSHPGDASARVVAVRAMGELGPSARAGLPLIDEALHDLQPAVRCEAVEAVGHVSGVSAAAVSQLREALRDADGQVRSAAARTLGGLGPGAAAAVPSLVAALEDEDRWVQQAATEAIGRMGPEAEDAARALKSRRDAKSDAQPSPTDQSGVDAQEKIQASPR